MTDILMLTWFGGAPQRLQEAQSRQASTHWPRMGPRMHAVSAREHAPRGFCKITSQATLRLRSLAKEHGRVEPPVKHDTEHVVLTNIEKRHETTKEAVLGTAIALQDCWFYTKFEECKADGHSCGEGRVKRGNSIQQRR